MRLQKHKCSDIIKNIKKVIIIVKCGICVKKKKTQIASHCYIKIIRWHKINIAQTNYHAITTVLYITKNLFSHFSIETRYNTNKNLI